MGLFKDDAGKTEKPTAGRLSEASNKGQVPLSREFTMAGTILIAVIMLMTIEDWLASTFRSLMEHGLNVNLEHHHCESGELPDMMMEVESMLLHIAWPFLTLMGIVMLGTLVSGYGQIGFKFRPGALRMRLEALNPVNNLSKLVSFSSVMRTVVSALKLLVLASVLYFVLEARMPQFTAMYEHASFSESVGVVIDTAFEILIWIAVIVLIISIGDIAWQRFSYIDNLKMSKQEVDDERKRNDGDPFIKSRLRKAALEIMQQRMMESIPKADVVITNPTHFSVALKYDRSRHHAPEVIAKGTDDVALKIRELAREHDVPLMEDPPLARALYRVVKVGQEVPAKFYQAVAAVLSQVYRLREGAA